jgi:hypothetical protein
VGKVIPKHIADRRRNGHVIVLRPLTIRREPMHKWLKAAFVGAIAVAAVGATSSAAYADVYTSTCFASVDDSGGVDCEVDYFPNSDTNPNNLAGAAGFEAYGEHLYAYDFKADGRGVYVAARWYDSHTGLNHFYDYRLTSGAHTSHDENLSIPEGIKVTLTGCQTDNGSLLNCRNRTATA